MLKSEAQHQFWVTKKTVQRKLGSKEDQYIVSSDAELDGKITLLRSISATCLRLHKVLDVYEDRLCVLSQEECSFGKFLKEIGKRSKTTAASIINSGKAIYFAGQQRMLVRGPLIRLYQEMDIFRCRAITDTEATVAHMEKERTEYRAALCWMKSLSTQLDPDNCKGLDKFRCAQSHVRVGKGNFDKLSTDCIQKIDLLTAARCNMFSHCLVAYVTSIEQFSRKVESALKKVAGVLNSNPQYDFFLLKDLYGEDSTDGFEAENFDKSMFFSKYLDDTLSDLPPKTQCEIDGGSITLKQIESSAKIKTMWLDSIENKKFVAAAKIADVTENDVINKNMIKSTLEGQEKEESNWLNLLTEFDPLENPEKFDAKLYANLNFQQT